MEYLVLYLLFINVIATTVCITDKFKARRGGWRISEKTLFVTSLLGGVVGMYITMKLIRHKTKHKRFMIGLPIIILLQSALAIYILHRYAWQSIQCGIKCIKLNILRGGVKFPTGSEENCSQACEPLRVDLVKFQSRRYSPDDRRSKNLF